MGISSKIFKMFITLILLQFFIADRISFAEGVNVVRLAGFPYPPFYLEENTEIRGIAAELINELFGRMKLKADLKIYPIKRALMYMESGERDAMMILIKTPEREKYMTYTDEIAKARGLIWSAADKPRIEFKNLEELKQYKIGVTRGYSYGADFDLLIRTMQADVVNTDTENFEKLQLHRIDIFPCNEMVAQGLFKQNPKQKGKFVHSENSFIEWKFYMGISKKSALVSRIAEINKVIAALKAEGIVDKLVNKYTR